MINDLKQEKFLGIAVNKLLALFQEPFEISGKKLSITSSIGAAAFPRDGQNIDELLKTADTAMYRAKNTRRNQCCFYTKALGQENSERLTMEADLRHAILHEEFFLFYQPQFDLTTEKLVSVEAFNSLATSNKRGDFAVRVYSSC